MAIAFANIFMATIENQTLRQSCIEPYPAHQRIFLTCGGMLQFRLQAGRSLAEGRSHLRQNREKRFEKKKLIAWVTIKTLPNRKHILKHILNLCINLRWIHLEHNWNWIVLTL